MFEVTVVAQRVVFDSIQNTGMEISNIDITPNMLATVRQSNAAFKAALEAKQRSDYRTAEDDRKQ